MRISRELSKVDPNFKVDIFLTNGDYILNWTERVGKRQKLRTFRNDTLEEAQRTARNKIQEHDALLKPNYYS